MGNFSISDLTSEVTYRRWASDSAKFFAEAWRIKHPSQGSILFDPFPAQRDAIKTFNDNRFVITLKARQLGWSTLCAARSAHEALFKPDTNVLFISRTERESRALLAQVAYGLRRLPEWFLERGATVLNPDNKESLQFSNGSSVTSLPSASDPARGSTASLIICDEFAFLPNPEDAWASIQPVADVGGRIIILSTANGSGDLFHSMWNGAVTGNNRFKPIFLPWSARPDRDDDWYAATSMDMPGWQLAQEYPSTPEEAFQKSGNAVFDIDILMEMEKHCKPGTQGFMHEVQQGFWQFRVGQSA